MSAFKKMYKEHKIQRKADLQAQATETVAQAQAALDKALDKYAKFPSPRQAYKVTAVRARVLAADARMPKFQTLAEFAASANGQEYMDLPDRTPGLMTELRMARMV